MAQDVEDVNLCLYCNKPCNATAIFCDECRVSLLNREHAFVPTRQASSATQAEEQECAGELHREVTAPPVNAAVFPVSPSLPRRSIPRRMRIALIMLLIVGILSLVVDGILLAANVLRHQPLSSTSVASNAAAGIDFSRHTTAAAGHGHDASNTPTVFGTSGTSTPLTPSTQTIGNGTPNPLPGTGKPWLQLSSLDLAFRSTQGQANPASQLLTLSNGNGDAFSWQIDMKLIPSWLSIAPTQGNAQASGNSRVTISPQAAQLTPGVYTRQLSISATSSAGASLQNSPQTFTATLTVQAPCVLQAAPFSLSFTAILLQNPPAQTVTLYSTGTCGLPIRWTASASASWVSFSSSSGSGDTLTVSTHMNSLLGSYKAQITLTAVDSNGVNVQVSPQTIVVTLTVIT